MKQKLTVCLAVIILMTVLVCIIPFVAVADETGVVLAADATVNPIVSIETAKPDPLTQGTNVKYQLFNTGIITQNGYQAVLNGRTSNLRPFTQNGGTNTTYIFTSGATNPTGHITSTAVNEAKKNNSTEAAPIIFVLTSMFFVTAGRRKQLWMNLLSFFRFRINKLATAT